MDKKEKIKVEIWSDFVCPFCYIGKRHFENALAKFPGNANVEIEWKSFQLDPGTKTDPDTTIYQALSNSKGWTEEFTRNSTQHVTQMAASAGLIYDFDKVVVANTLNAHRLMQFAKSKKRGDEVEEKLFHAYFSEGKNIDDNETLLAIGSSIGLDAEELKNVLADNSFSKEVHEDISEASAIGVRGVPFFVLDRKYAVSGAQPSDVFLSALNAVLEEKQKAVPVKDAEISGDVCTPGGECD